jgi:hypothetical protein
MVDILHQLLKETVTNFKNWIKDLLKNPEGQKKKMKRQSVK